MRSYVVCTCALFTQAQLLKSFAVDIGRPNTALIVHHRRQRECFTSRASAKIDNAMACLSAA